MPDGDFQILALIIIAFVIIVLSFIIGFIFFFRRKKIDEEKKRELRESHFQKELTDSKLEIQFSILKSFSDEIHDNIGQLLSLASITTEKIETSDFEKKKQALQLINESIDQLRGLSKNLNPDRLEKIGIAEAIKQELEKLEKTGKYQTIFDYQDYPDQLSGKEQLILFRVMQEALQNIIKHSKASKITVSLHKKLGFFEIKIIDNGIGFDAETDPSRHGLGISNMKSRVAALSSQIDFSSIPNTGTTITIILPEKD